jgi:hypothetical protein
MANPTHRLLSFDESTSNEQSEGDLINMGEDGDEDDQDHTQGEGDGMFSFCLCIYVYIRIDRYLYILKCDDDNTEVKDCI